MTPETVLEIFEKDQRFSHYKEETLEKFVEFHTKNPHVYQEFSRLAQMAKDAGHKKYSSKTIYCVMRWLQDLQTTGNRFKVNDMFQSIYARLLINQKPEYDGFFELRVRDEVV